jgi:hypothetical protein
MISAGRTGEFFAQAANKDIDDLELGFVCLAVEMFEKHFLGYDRALVQAEQLEKSSVIMPRSLCAPARNWSAVADSA